MSADLHTTEGFARFLAEQRPRLEAVARRVVRDRHAAEDVVSDAAIRVWRKLEVQAPDNPAGYLTAAVRNEALDHLRRRTREQRTLEAVGPTAAGAGEEARVDDRDQVQRLLATLPDAQRSTLRLRYELDLSEREIARRLGVPPGTVKSHAHRAIRRLRDETRPA